MQHLEYTPQYYAQCAKNALGQNYPAIVNDLLDVIINYNTSEAEDAYRKLPYYAFLP